MGHESPPNRDFSGGAHDDFRGVFAQNHAQTGISGLYDTPGRGRGRLSGHHFRPDRGAIGQTAGKFHLLVQGGG